MLFTWRSFLELPNQNNDRFISMTTNVAAKDQAVITSNKSLLNDEFPERYAF